MFDTVRLGGIDANVQFYHDLIGFQIFYDSQEIYNI